MPLTFVQANTDGRLHDAALASISPLDRGFLYGDAIYEVWRTYGGIVFGWREHCERLTRSAAALHLELPCPLTELWQQIRRTVTAYRTHSSDHGDVYVRLQISRGAGAIGLDPALSDRAAYVILVQAVPVMPATVAQNGLHLSVGRSLRRNPREALDPAWKTGNYLNNLLALHEVRSRGADDVVLLNLAGEVTECSTSNLGFVRGGAVVTPPLHAGILAGVTRRLLLEAVAAKAGYAMGEETVLPGDFAAMDECFVMSSTKDIQPVGRIDNQTYPVTADSVTGRLKVAFQEFAQNYATTHPEQRV